jgi:hypothetical protein
MIALQALLRPLTRRTREAGSRCAAIRRDVLEFTQPPDKAGMILSLMNGGFTEMMPNGSSPFRR